MTTAAQPLPHRRRLQSRRLECLRVGVGYLLAVFLLQVLSALPQGLQTGRHVHAPGVAAVDVAGATVMRTALPFASTRPSSPASQQGTGRGEPAHVHDGEFHVHGADAPGVQPLGEADDGAAGASALPLWAVAWPGALPLPGTVGRDGFGPTADVRFDSRDSGLPLQPPRG